MMNFDLSVMTVCRFLEEQRDTDIPTQYWAIPEKKTGGLRTYIFENPPEIFRFFTLPMEIPNKTRLHPEKLYKIVLATPLENFKALNQDP